MGGRLFGNLPLTAPMREFRPDRAEPRLFPGSVSRTVHPSAVGDAPALRAAAVAERVTVSSPTIAAADRVTASEFRVPAGRRRSLGVAGLIAAVAIAAFGGTGLWLLASPAKVTVAGSAAQSASPSAPISAETALPHAAAAIAAPAASVVQHPAESETPSHPQINAAQARPQLPPRSAAPQSAPAPAPSAGRTVPAFASTKTAPISPSSALAASTRHAAASLPSRDEPRDHTRPAARHAHLRSAHDRRPPAPRESRVARSSPPQAVQTRSFDQLLTQLTGRNPPAGQALTPPPADQPDPFAPRASSR
jgi:hypothetical protein